MIAGLIIAGLVSFVAGFILHVGAFSIFALITNMLYLALIYESTTVFASLASTAALFVIMQIAYVIGVLVPFPSPSKDERTGFSFPKMRRRIGSLRNKSG
ncbi:hypothetical protein [Rhizobium herbae]|uniref:Mg/Co/Ni transporter MgtE n=1 Tax=Rhizobium herbae TaxID=508661 RepID=A0ABS4EVP6_9HYPH|nr:hypothetical protein [Rhizobium herbae]MBP1862036.1 Mg/Co/Ni transporter MgtE [Rhizobium herbae]